MQKISHFSCGVLCPWFGEKTPLKGGGTERMQSLLILQDRTWVCSEAHTETRKDIGTKINSAQPFWFYMASCTECEELRILNKLWGHQGVVKHPALLTLVERAVWDTAQLPLDLVCNWKCSGCKHKDKNLRNKRDGKYILVTVLEKNTLSFAYTSALIP